MYTKSTQKRLRACNVFVLNIIMKNARCEEPDLRQAKNDNYRRGRLHIQNMAIMID